MTIKRKITLEKILRYVFFGLSISGGILVLLNLVACLGTGGEGPIIRGWVHYGHRPVQPELLAMASGQIKIYNMSQIQFAVVHFESLGAMLRGIPLVYLLFQVLLELSVVMVLYQLMQIFRSLDEGDVFRSNNLTRMRHIAYAILTYSLLTLLNAHLLAVYIQGSGDTLRSAYSYLTIERLLGGILVALIVFALQKAFSLGTQLQQEQDLTI
jgi:hypothetical protein